MNPILLTLALLLYMGAFALKGYGLAMMQAGRWSLGGAILWLSPLTVAAIILAVCLWRASK